MLAVCLKVKFSRKEWCTGLPVFCCLMIVSVYSILFPMRHQDPCHIDSCSPSASNWSRVFLPCRCHQSRALYKAAGLTSAVDFVMFLCVSSKLYASLYNLPYMSPSQENWDLIDAGLVQKALFEIHRVRARFGANLATKLRSFPTCSSLFNSHATQQKSTVDCVRVSTIADLSCGCCAAWNTTATS